MFCANRRYRRRRIRAWDRQFLCPLLQYRQQVFKAQATRRCRGCQYGKIRRRETEGFRQPIEKFRVATRLDFERQIFDLSLQIAGLHSDLVYLAYSLLEYLLCLVPLFDSDRKGRVKRGYGLVDLVLAHALRDVRCLRHFECSDRVARPLRKHTLLNFHRGGSHFQNGIRTASAAVNFKTEPVSFPPPVPQGREAVVGNPRPQAAEFLPRAETGPRKAHLRIEGNARKKPTSKGQ